MSSRQKASPPGCSQRAGVDGTPVSYTSRQYWQCPALTAALTIVPAQFRPPATVKTPSTRQICNSEQANHFDRLRPGEPSSHLPALYVGCGASSTFYIGPERDNFKWPVLAWRPVLVGMTPRIIWYRGILQIGAVPTRRTSRTLYKCSRPETTRVYRIHICHSHRLKQWRDLKRAPLQASALQAACGV